MLRLRQLMLFGAILAAAPAFAGFPSSETFLPAVGRVTGQGGAQFYTTVWATNLTSTPVSFTFDFLKQGQANATPVSFADTLAPGQTKVYENVVESKFGLASAIGAARVTAEGEILVSERIYNQPPGADVGNTEGLFFAGVPKSLSISTGQSASIQGINQGGSENFRYNFALVETGGGSPTVNVQLFDGNGNVLGQKAYVLEPYEQIQPNVADVFPGVATTNARLTATVTGGSGSALIAGAQLANESQDSSGFEMSFRDDLLGGGGAGVSSLNSLIGAVSLIAGTNITLTNVGNGIKIDAAGGSASGAGVSSVNSLTGALSITSGNGISVSSSGHAIQVTYTGGGTSGLPYVAHDTTLSGDGTGASPLGLTLPFDQTRSISGSLFKVTNTGTAIDAASTDGFGVAAASQNNHAVSGTTAAGGYAAGVFGYDTSSGIGVYGETDNTGAWAIFGNANAKGLAGNFVGEVAVNGNLTVTGSYPKMFVDPHPTDPGKELRFVCLEGPESGTYFRGTGKIVGGIAKISVPESFRLATSPDGLTVVATPVGRHAALFVAEASLDAIVLHADADVDFHFIVNGVRKGLENFEPIAENTHYVPRSASDRLFAKGMKPEAVKRLKASGILNDDGSINLDTAHRLGWDQRPGWNDPPAAAATPGTGR